MTRRPPGQVPGGAAGEGEFARADALAGLAREVDGLRRGLDPLAGLPTRVDDLARTVAQLADAVVAVPARPGPSPAPSWLAAPADPEATGRVLEELCGWLGRVFLRYPDGAAVLSECWLWHPDVVEELLWLMQAWLVAYQGKTASVQLAGDWHDRQRPGVVRRLRTSIGSCSKERHQTRPGWSDNPTGAATVPGLNAITAIAGWWAHGRDQPAPEPEPWSGSGAGRGAGGVGDWSTGPGHVNGAHR